MPVVHRGGGAATHGGTGYQNRVAAWIAVRILAEQAATCPCDLPAQVSLEYVGCETSEPVDDILVKTSGDGTVYIQAKQNLDLGRSVNSRFGETVSQFVGQFLARRESGEPLSAEKDRLVLAVDSRSSGRVRTTLTALLGRLREFPNSESLEGLEQGRIRDTPGGQGHHHGGLDETGR